MAKSLDLDDVKASVEAFVDKEHEDVHMKLYTLLMSGKYEEVIGILESEDIDVNAPIAKINDNTFYTLVVVDVYVEGDPAANVVLKYLDDNYAPKAVANAVGLTYKDYIKNNKLFY
jgi:hypothetical protein